MAKSSQSLDFLWAKWQSGVLPTLEHHSEKKLEILRDYLVLYLRIVLANAQGKEKQALTLIDGFAGGGTYQNGKEGSPLVILRAVKEAEALINAEREKPVQIVPICYFIERNADAFACLSYQLHAAGYGSQLGKTIHLRQQGFELCAAEIVADIRIRHSRGGNRTIFFLDQCGYTQVPARLIRDLDQQLNGRAEFIINFSIGWFGDFLSEATVANYSSVLTNLGLIEHVDVSKLLLQRQALDGNWRHAVESYVGQGYHRATGIKCFSPFYIEPHDNHRGYWLLHLAQNQRARAAMTEIHWSKANRSKHYGPKGYGILSYKPDLDPTLYIKGMSFDETSRTECETTLTADFAQLFRDKFSGGIRFDDLENLACNQTIADEKMLGKVLWDLSEHNQIEIASPSGKEKRTRILAEGDIIRPKQQLIFTGFEDALRPRSRRKASPPSPS